MGTFLGEQANRFATIAIAASCLFATVGCREAANSSAAPALSGSAAKGAETPGVQKLSAPHSSSPASSQSSPEDARWNSGIAWLSMDDGFEAAKRDGKPIVLVFYADWCPHCRNYAKLFHDPQVIELSADFAMVRVDEDAAPHLGAKWKPDGGYVPRTFFLSPDGHMDVDLIGSNPKFKHFLDEDSPAQLLALMGKARRKFAK